MINEQRKQINNLTVELQKAHNHIDSLYHITDSSALSGTSKLMNELNSRNVDHHMDKSESSSTPSQVKFKAKTLYKPKINFKISKKQVEEKQMTEFDENAIRTALRSSTNNQVLFDLF